ncbi:MAG: hypothetical protein MI922_26595 [Bacteroidales bacterium]|nr:hypothetical protein [Bacteroidales bacterium]
MIITERKEHINTLNLFAEFENEVLVSQMAKSKDIDRINDDIIESVRFRFINNDFINQPYNVGSKNLVELDDLQQEGKLFDSENELMDELLKNKNAKHYRQIKYLINKHQSHILKIRFVLSPFSFVFLLSGEQQYHIVLETLDSEEATYIWHIEKDELKKQLIVINNDLNVIRNQGRQHFISNPPANFNRIIHDYSDEKKGFITWKGNLEEWLA